MAANRSRVTRLDVEDPGGPLPDEEEILAAMSTLPSWVIRPDSAQPTQGMILDGIVDRYKVAYPRALAFYNWLKNTVVPGARKNEHGVYELIQDDEKHHWLVEQIFGVRRTTVQTGSIADGLGQLLLAAPPGMSMFFHTNGAEVSSDYACALLVEVRTLAAS